jgi:hypothetical protein
MMAETSDLLEKWARDRDVLIEIGRQLRSQNVRHTVTLPTFLAEKAVAAWERDDDTDYDSANETEEQARLRAHAATLAFIGLDLKERGSVSGPVCVIDLPAREIADALAAADDDEQVTRARASIESRGQ